MKIFNLVSNIVIIIAIVVMWAMHPKCGDESCADAPAQIASGEKMNVAYVNIDSVLMNYQKAIDLNEELMSEEEDARTTLTQQARALEADMQEFQRKVENNGFLTRERAQAKQQELLARQQQLEQSQQVKANELGLQQQELNQNILKSLNSFIAEYNEKAGYDMIFTQDGAIGTILYANEAYDVTEEVLTQLNEQYKNEK